MPPQTRAGLLRLTTVIAVLGALAGLTYFFPGMKRFQPWVPGEAVPLSSLATMLLTPPPPLTAGGVSTP